MQFKIATYNIHKGFSSLNRRVILPQLRDSLQLLGADIVFLQESQGQHQRHAARFENYPEQAQHEFLAGDHWPHVIYGKNAVYEAGHHGNALLSRLPISQFQNHDISAHRFEQRGLLHAEVVLAEGVALHCLCTHFGLFAKGRRQQTDLLVQYVQQHIPSHTPLVIAGDFNDWRNEIGQTLAQQLAMFDVFDLIHGKPARSFPAKLPLLRLDRIYVRGLRVLETQVHFEGIRQHLSDHAALTASLQLEI